MRLPRTLIMICAVVFLGSCSGESGEGGPAGTQPIGLRLVKSEGSAYYDGLFIDLNRDGSFDSTEFVETEVSESRNKFWSSFDAVVGIPVTDPKTGGRAVNPFPLSL